MLPKPLSAGYVSPMLPTLVDEAPDGKEWLHEIKYDGYRTQLAIEGQMIRAFTRNGHDWSDRYVPVIASARALRCRSAILDGEMCVQAASGVTDFAALRSAIKGAPQRLVLFAFDLLMLDRSRPAAPSRWSIVVATAARPDRRRDRQPACTSAGTAPGGGPAFFKAADAARARGDRVQARGQPVSHRPLRRLAQDQELHRRRLRGDRRRALVGIPVALREGLVARVRHLKGEEKLRHTRRSRRSTSASCWRTISVAATNRTSKAAAAPHKAASILAWRR